MKKAIKKTVFCGVIGGLLFALQVAFSFLPNIEVVSLLIAILAVVFGFSVLPAVYVFVLLEGLMYGFHIWWICYLYLWLILFCVCALLKKIGSGVVFSLILCLFGLSFGALCTIPYWIAEGTGFAVKWWLAGVGFDLIHGIANLVLGLVLFVPLRRLAEKLKMQFWT